MSITDYAGLVASARQQDQPQRLLFTFTRAEAEPGGQGKSLTPVLCADKLPEELSSFEQLLEESKQMPAHWDVVFVAGLAGSNGQRRKNAKRRCDPWSRRSRKDGSIVCWRLTAAESCYALAESGHGRSCK